MVSAAQPQNTGFWTYLFGSNLRLMLSPAVAVTAGWFYVYVPSLETFTPSNGFPYALSGGWFPDFVFWFVLFCVVLAVPLVIRKSPSKRAFDFVFTGVYAFMAPYVFLAAAAILGGMYTAYVGFMSLYGALTLGAVGTLIIGVGLYRLVGSTLK
jgi:hypothetical protein